MMRTRFFADPRTFGRRAVRGDMAMVAQAPALGDDLKLFVMTFAGGFLFMTVYLA